MIFRHQLRIKHPAPVRLPIALLLLCGVFLVASLSACDGAEITAEEHVQRAKDYQDKGELNASVIELKNALRQNPANPEARWLLGMALVDTGQGAAALKELEQARKLGIAEEAVIVPIGKAMLLQEDFQSLIDDYQVNTKFTTDTNAQILASRGKAYLESGQADNAHGEFEKSLELNPELAAAILGKAQLAINERRGDDANELIGKVLKTSPENAEAWALYGDLLSMQGKLDESETAYTSAIANRPNNLIDHAKRALIRVSTKDFEGAARDIDLVKRNANSSPLGYYAGGLLQLQQEHLELANSEFQEALRRNPDYLPAVLYMGALQLRLGNLELAESYLRSFLQKTPGSDYARLLVGILEYQKEEFDNAILTLGQLETAYPENHLVLTTMGKSHLALQENDLAISYLQRAAVSQPDSAETRLDLGISLLQHGDQGSGLKEIESAITLDPGLVQADVALTLSHLRMREFDKALETADRLHTKNPQAALPLNLMALAYMGKGNEDQARSILNEALEKEPGDPGSTSTLAKIALRNNDIELAGELYREVLKYHPGYLPALMELFSLESERGDNDAAIKWLQQAVKSNPDALRPRVLLARYYLQHAQPARALELMREVEALFPENPLLLVEIGRAQLALQQPENAEFTFKKLIRLRPQLAGAHYYLSQAYAAQNKSARMHKSLDKTLAVKPDHYLAKLALVRLLLQEGQLQQAEKYLDELRQSRPEDPELDALAGDLAMRHDNPQAAVKAYRSAAEKSASSALTVRLMQALWQTGDHAGGKNLLQTWLAEHPEDVRVREALAEAHLSLNELDQAREAYSKVVEQTPNATLALNNLAWLMRKEDPARAMEYGQRALELAPGSPVVQDTVAMLLLDKGEKQRALRLLQQASAAMPQSMGIRYHYAQALLANGNNKQARLELQALVDDQRPFAQEAEVRALLEKAGD